MAETVFTAAPDDVLEIASEIMELPDHEHIIQCAATVRWMMRREAAKKKGKIIYGTAQVVSGLNAALAGSSESFFCIVLAADVWIRLNDNGKRALVDHELLHCYCEMNDEGVVQYSMRSHDIEEFGNILNRYGLWKEDLKQIAPAFVSAQERLDLGLEDAPVSEGRRTSDGAPTEIKLTAATMGKIKEFASTLKQHNGTISVGEVPN